MARFRYEKIYMFQIAHKNVACITMVPIFETNVQL